MSERHGGMATAQAKVRNHRPRLDKTVQLSKLLSWVLRHAAEKEGVTISDAGFVAVEDILAHNRFYGKYSLQEILHVVNTNDKQRFTLREESDGKIFIKANQGHSLPNVQNLELVPILNENEALTVIHGTYLKHWENIKVQGLSRMNRVHIHFASGEPGDCKVISGMRSSCELYIYIDVSKALRDGLKFFKSPNSVILSPGNADGLIETKYFLKVLQKVSGKKFQEIYINRT